MKNHLSLSPSESGPTLVARRQFLVLGSAAVATVAATSLSGDIVRSALVIEDTTPRLSVGFTAATLAEFSEPSFAPRLTAASQLRAGDQSLANGVRLRIHGLVRPAAAKAGRSSVAVDVLYRVPGMKEAVPFMAWSHAPVGTSSAGSFVVPVTDEQPLSLAVLTSAAGAMADAKLRGTVTLDLGSKRRTNKLRTGLYFVAVCPAGTKAPDWTAVHAVPGADGLPALKKFTLTGYENVPFDYVVMASDRA